MREAILVLVLGDIILSILSVYVGFTVRFQKLFEFHELLYAESLNIAIFSVITIFMTFFGGLYKIEYNLGKKKLLAKIAVLHALSFLVLSSSFYLAPTFLLGRGVLFASIVAFGLFQSMWHVTYKFCLNLPGIAKRVLILGSGPLARTIGGVIHAKSRYFVLAGYVSCTDGATTVPQENVIGSCDELCQVVKKIKADHIVVSLSEHRGILPLHGMLACKLNGIEVTDAVSFYEMMTGKLLLENIRPSSLIYCEGFKITRLNLFLKRVGDILFAAVGLVLVLPFFPLIALLIKLDSRGPAFYKQMRVGQGEKNFMLYKFRTMARDSENDTGAVWAQKNDPRVTRVGSFLRKSRLDELPQLFNVLRGDLSFIGPRPERPEFIEELKKIIPYYSERHVIKPGLTGWAQVKYPYGASVQDAIEKLKYDLYYLKNLSFVLDMTVVLDTVKVVLLREGSR